MYPMMQVGKRKSMALTTILAFLIMGVGHIYLGRVRRGFVIFMIGFVGSIVASGMSSIVQPQGETGPLTDDLSILGAFFGLVIVVLGLFVWQIADARQECRKFNGGLERFQSS